MPIDLEACYQSVAKSAFLREHVPELISLVTRCEKGIPASCTATTKKQWREQIFVNIPVLYLASLLVHIHANASGSTKFLFATRDCVHFQKIFATLFPRHADNTHYFHCSRIMLERAREHRLPAYDRYVRKLLTGDAEADSARVRKALATTMFVDLHGTGKRIIKYCERRFGLSPFVFVLSSKFRGYDELPDVSRAHHAANKLQVPVWRIRGSPIEMLNYDLIGTLQTYCSTHGPVRDKLEYSEAEVRPYHECVSECIEQIRPIRGDLLSIRRPDSIYHQLLGELRQITTQIQEDKPVIAKKIAHVAKHKKN